jgi:hypothetical protein
VKYVPEYPDKGVMGVSIDEAQTNDASTLTVHMTTVDACVHQQTTTDLQLCNID